MPREPNFALRQDMARARHDAERLYARIERKLRDLLAPPIDIRHIGATSISGCLTKGDLDIVVRVDPARFLEIDRSLEEHFERNSGSVRTSSFSAFEDADAVPPLGIQLTAINGPDDRFHHFADALRSAPALVERYNALKIQFDGRPMAAYRAAKDDFIAGVLSTTMAAPRIVRWIDQPDRAAIVTQIDTIFFEASGTKTFSSDEARAAFRQRWLGLYLDSWPEHVHLARDADGTVAGYLIGSLVNPALDARFDGIGYFKAFAKACAAYPAHLHINLAPVSRGKGIGGALIAAFADAARRAGAPGLHIVTGAAARNVGFYRQQGFEVIATTATIGGTVVLMGLRL
jgi:GrpB-like predicted nucleotidyltransferase (UPF0157 family)/GNAT superfamily N-acetyltransferase